MEATEIYIQEPSKVFNTATHPNNSWRKCNNCGKFISYKQMEQHSEAVFHFVPDSEITTEEAYWVHRKCNL